MARFVKTGGAFEKFFCFFGVFAILYLALKTYLNFNIIQIIQQSNV
jgi:hypothetical protein